ncbi:MAG: MarR family transcriptional regulator [Actinobacteria bacterium]|nr:MarR family transcriptional regulator [Actinomycetota bacterium]
MTLRKLVDDDYQRVLEFRTAIRRFLSWSRDQATEAGITPTQHQLLLAVRGIDYPTGATISRIAECLLLQHHSAVELIDRAVAIGLVKRLTDTADRRLVRVRLTARGERALEQITRAHFEELDRLAPQMTRLLAKIGPSTSG